MPVELNGSWSIPQEARDERGRRDKRKKLVAIGLALMLCATGMFASMGNWRRGYGDGKVTGVEGRMELGQANEDAESLGFDWKKPVPMEDGMGVEEENAKLIGIKRVQDRADQGSSASKICSSAQLLNDSTRLVSNRRYVLATVCDRYNMVAGWYKYPGYQIPTSPPPQLRCGTAATGWLDLNGASLPAQGQRIKTKACLNYGGSKCWLGAVDVEVLNCGLFFAYFLRPKMHCNSRYCFEAAGPSSVSPTKNPSRLPTISPTKMPTKTFTRIPTKSPLSGGGIVPTCFVTVVTASVSEGIQMCKDGGGEIATIRSIAANEAVATACKNEICWLGLVKNPSTSAWEWIDGTGATYTAWASGHPGGNGVCAEMDGVTKKWKAVSCDQQRKVVCMKPMKEYFLTGWVVGSQVEASLLCKVAGGRLATITSAAENNAAKAAALGGQSCWVGLIKDRQSGKFVWEGESCATTYTNWASGEPSGDGSCGSMFGSGKLNDRPCVVRNVPIRGLCQRLVVV